MPAIVHHKTILIHKSPVYVPHTFVLPHWDSGHHAPECCDPVIQMPTNNCSKRENQFDPNDHSIYGLVYIWLHPRLRHPPECSLWRDADSSETRPQNILCLDPRECIVGILWRCVLTKLIRSSLDLLPIHWRETNLEDWGRNHPTNFRLLRFCMVFCWFYGFIFQVPF